MENRSAMNFFSPNQEVACNGRLELLKFNVRNLFSLQSAQKRYHCREELLES